MARHLRERVSVAKWVRPYLALMVRMGGGAKFDAAVVRFVKAQGMEVVK